MWFKGWSWVWAEQVSSSCCWGQSKGREGQSTHSTGMFVLFSIQSPLQWSRFYLGLSYLIIFDTWIAPVFVHCKLTSALICVAADFHSLRLLFTIFSSPSSVKRKTSGNERLIRSKLPHLLHQLGSNHICLLLIGDESVRRESQQIKV